MTRTNQGIEVAPGLRVTAEQIRDLLANDRNDRVITGEEVRFHEFPFMAFPKGMTYGRAIDILEQKREDEEKETVFSREFNYRPNDGAVAAANVMKRMWGMALGKAIRTFFGERPPQLRSVAIGPNEKIQVPWGLVQIPALEGLEIHLGMNSSADFGTIFHVIAKGPNRYRSEMDLFFGEIEKELATNSIYRGHALIGADSMEFIDLSSFDPTKIVFSDEVTNVLENALWGTLEHTAALHQENIPIKRALLLHGPYGTGKSSIAWITAQKAERNGWTTIISKTTDRVEDVLRTARLYEPAVVVIEDIDTQANSGQPKDVSALLDAFDGIVAKSAEIVMVLTTNHADRIHQGMLRPGRLDYTVEVSFLDRNGVERLIRAIVPKGKLAENIDYDAVFAAADEFGPAFVKAVADRAKTWALIANGGKSDYVIDTESLVYAARSLQPQLALLRGAGEGELPPTLDTALTVAVEGAVKNTLEKVVFRDDDGDVIGHPHHVTVETESSRN